MAGVAAPVKLWQAEAMTEVQIDRSMEYLEDLRKFRELFKRCGMLVEPTGGKQFYVLNKGTVDPLMRETRHWFSEHLTESQSRE